MKVFKKFLLVEYSESKVDDKILPKLSLGDMEGAYYSRNSPDFLFDTEEDAIAEAYKRNRYGNYLVIPQISFDIWEF